MRNFEENKNSNKSRDANKEIKQEQVNNLPMSYDMLPVREIELG